MSETNEQQQAQTPPEAQPTQQQQVDLAEELRELGQQLETAFRGVVESEHAKNLQRDLLAGLREIGNQMQSGLSSLKDDPRVQNLAERGQQVVNQAQESQPARDFQDVLARGAAFLKEQIAGFNERQRTASPRSSEGQPTSQSVTIEHHHDDVEETTGETTRLDPEA